MIELHLEVRLIIYWPNGPIGATVHWWYGQIRIHVMTFGIQGEWISTAYDKKQALLFSMACFIIALRIYNTNSQRGQLKESAQARTNSCFLDFHASMYRLRKWGPLSCLIQKWKLFVDLLHVLSRLIICRKLKSWIFHAALAFVCGSVHVKPKYSSPLPSSS